MAKKVKRQYRRTRVTRKITEEDDLDLEHDSDSDSGAEACAPEVHGADIIKEEDVDAGHSKKCGSLVIM